MIKNNLKTKRKNTPEIILIPFMLYFFVFPLHSSAAAKSGEQTKIPAVRSEYIFPLQDEHVHSSCITELSNGDLLCCWFQGSGERTADDVRIMGARLKKGQATWSNPFVMADTPDYPDCNPVIFLDGSNRLHLVWIVVVGNKWEASLLKTKISTDYLSEGAPKWDWQDVILLKPGKEFPETLESGFKELGTAELAWSEYAPQYEKMIVEASKDPVKRETGWMTRIKPLIISPERILLPLYSDGFNVSLIAMSDDNGDTWTCSRPITGRGNVQPAILQKQDGTLIAYMRDNGDAPGRIMQSISRDGGLEWYAAKKTEFPNPGSSIDAISLTNGDWILVYNDLEEGRYRLAVSLSDDEGKSWKWKKYIENDSTKNGRYAYPSVIQGKDGLIHISYSHHSGKEKTIKHMSFPENWIKNNN